MGAAGFAWYVGGTMEGAPLEAVGAGILPGAVVGGIPMGNLGPLTWPGMEGAPGGATICGMAGADT